MLIALLLCAAYAGAFRYALGQRALGQSALGQLPEEKLKASTDYVPQASGTVNQLIEVAQRFKIPMAVEWVDGEATPDEKLRSRKRSVKELLEEIIRASRDHRVEIDGALVRIYSPAVAAHPFNFLNLRIDDYFVKEGDLFAADDQLRWAIRFTLEPEKYKNGYGGGYGHGANDVFEFPKITLKGSDLTIREVLNRIAVAQGNALWVATIKGADLEAEGPWWKTIKDDDARHVPITSAWNFLPLSNIAELAQEQVAVDVMIEGLLDERMTTIPVVLEHALIGDSGGGRGGSSSAGFFYQYGASVEKAGPDFVILAVHLTVSRPGEIERKFDERVRVTRGQVTELVPAPRVRVRAYFEPCSEISGGGG
jgi:hypothetical protein